MGLRKRVGIDMSFQCTLLYNTSNVILQSVLVISTLLRMAHPPDEFLKVHHSDKIWYQRNGSD